jgi:hypothetical protein
MLHSAVCMALSSSGAQYVTSPQIFFTSKFSYLLFFNPTHKTETGTANRRGTINSEQPGPIIYDRPITNTEQQVRSYLLHFFLQVHIVIVPFTQPWQSCAMVLSQNKFSSAKRACFDFSSSNLVLQNHILSTAGDALSQQPNHHVLHTCALNTPLRGLQLSVRCTVLHHHGSATGRRGCSHFPPTKDCFHTACPGNKEQSYMFS